jgi:hypothetical protein
VGRSTGGKGWKDARPDRLPRGKRAIGARKGEFRRALWTDTTGVHTQSSNFLVAYGSDDRRPRHADWGECGKSGIKIYWFKSPLAIYECDSVNAVRLSQECDSKKVAGIA